MGYAALHPFSMLIHRYFGESVEFSAWDVLRASFSPGHLSTAAYFVLIGAAFGAVYAVRKAMRLSLLEFRHPAPANSTTTFPSRMILTAGTASTRKAAASSFSRSTATLASTARPS